MSAKRSSFGMHHVTVVPTNFTPRDSEDASRDEAAVPEDEDATVHDDETRPNRAE